MSLALNALLLAFGAAAFSQESLPQVTALQARHHAGQTFLTWREVRSPLREARVSFPEFRKVQAALDQSEKIRYRIYRSLEPILTVDGLQPLAEVKPLSCWSGHFNGYGDPKETDWTPRYIVAEGQPPLVPGTGLYEARTE